MVTRALFATAAVTILILSGTVTTFGESTSWEPPSVRLRMSAIADVHPSLRAGQGPQGQLANRPDPAGFTVTIFPNGTVVPWTAPITTSGTSYRLTANLTGSILDERNESQLDGNGKEITALLGAPVGLELYRTVGVTITNIRLATARTGVLLQDVEGASITASQVTTAQLAIDVENSTSVTILQDIARATDGIFGNHDSGLSVLSTDLENSTIAAVQVQHTTGSAIEDLRANGSTDGIRVENGSWANLSGNDLASKIVGIFEYGVSGSVLVSNRLYASPRSIILIDSVALSASADWATPPSVGIEIVGASNVTLEGESILGGTSEGLLIEDSSETAVRASTIAVGSGIAVSIVDSNLVTVAGSNLSSTGSSGVVVNGSSNVRCAGDSVHPAPAPGDAAFSSFDDRNLTISSSVVAPGAIGVIDDESSVLSIRGNDFANGSGHGAEIQLAQDREVLVRENLLTGGGGDGISADRVEQIAVVGNEVSSVAIAAIRVTNSTDITVQGNTALHAGVDAIALENSTQFVVSGNVGGASGVASGTGFYGYGLATGTVVDNTILDSNRAVALEASRSVEILSNNLSQSFCGLTLVDDLNSSAAADQVWEDWLIVNVSGDNDLWIYHNNFVNDSGWSIGTPLAGVHWDAGYPEGGNYWSNFSGPDTESGASQDLSGPDGIVDTPFSLEKGVDDHYPLLVPWTGYYVIFTATGLFTAWSVVVNGVSYSSPAPTIIVPESNAPNSTFGFFVPLPRGYVSVFPQSLGPFEEPRANATFAIAFQTYPASFYALSIEEFGLALGTTWGIVVGSTFYQKSVDRFSIPSTNGSYSYLASTVSGYTLEVGSGDAIVAGSSQTITILYLPDVPVTTTGSSAPSIPPTFFVAIGIALVAFVIISFVLSRKRPGRSTPPSAPGLDDVPNLGPGDPLADPRSQHPRDWWRMQSEGKPSDPLRSL